MAGAFLTVHCGAERRTGRLWHEAAVGIALLMLLTCSVTIGPFLLAFSYAPERVLEVQGQPLVEEDESFLDPYYVYYIGFGPLLRSRESVWSGDTPLNRGDEIGTAGYCEAGKAEVTWTEMQEQA